MYRMMVTLLHVYKFRTNSNIFSIDVFTVSGQVTCKHDKDRS